MPEVPLRGLIVDWGGVFIDPVPDRFTAWLAEDRIDGERYRAVLRDWLGSYGSPRDGDGNPVHALERGEIGVPRFERLLAGRLCTVDGGPVAPEGLLARMFSCFGPAAEMTTIMPRARAAGIRTCLLSNSWGMTYDRDGWEDMFDTVVISGEVGMRKPEERIYRHALEAIGLAAHECAFVDDLADNIRAAERLGIVGVHHLDAESTVGWLEELFGASLTAT